MQLFLPFLFLLLSNPIHGHKSTKMVILQRRDLAVKAAAPAPSASNATGSAAAPVATDTPPTPKVDLISLMSKKGCKNFASLVTARAGDVASTFEDSVSGGLTVFCPTDGAMKAFMPKFKNLSADSKVSLLLYHGVPEYNTLDFLRNNNGVVNTLATAARDYNFTVQNIGSDVTLESHVTTASIKSTIFDKDPLAIFSIDTVLEPRELFKPPPEAPAPAPEAPAPEADAPAAGKKGKKKKKKHEASAPAGPDAAPADQKAADENGVERIWVPKWAAAMAVVVAVVVVVG